jgi:hypothetical protein
MRQGVLRSLGSVVWPAFLGAAALEILVFAFVDPQHLTLPGGGEFALSPIALYSLSFFAFWAVVAGACVLTMKLGCSASEINAAGGGADADRADPAGGLRKSGR